MYEIPVSNEPDQNFACTIPVDNKNLTLNLRIRYNTQASYWQLSIYDKDKNLLVDNLPLLTGLYPAGNILGQYSYLKIGSAYVIPAGKTINDAPSDTDLGNNFGLVWGDTVG